MEKNFTFGQLCLSFPLRVNEGTCHTSTKGYRGVTVLYSHQLKRSYLITVNISIYETLTYVCVCFSTMYVTTTERMWLNTEIQVFVYVQNCRKKRHFTWNYTYLIMHIPVVCHISFTQHCNIRLMFCIHERRWCLSIGILWQ